MVLTMEIPKSQGIRDVSSVNTDQISDKASSSSQYLGIKINLINNPRIGIESTNEVIFEVDKPSVMLNI